MNAAAVGLPPQIAMLLSKRCEMCEDKRENMSRKKLRNVGRKDCITGVYRGMYGLIVVTCYLMTLPKMRWMA